MYGDRSKVLALSQRVISHYFKVLAVSPFSESKALDIATLQMASRIVEFQRTCHLLVEQNVNFPVAMLCLARSQYESLLNLLFIFVARTDLEREHLARTFIEFGSYQQIHQLRPDNKEYRDSLDVEGQKNFDRHVAAYRKVKANFTEKQIEQKKKGEVTWNGLSFAGTAKSIGWEERHREWYGLLCLVTHPSAAMFHKSVTFTDQEVMLSQIDNGASDSIARLFEITRWTFTAIAYIRVLRTIEAEHEEGIALCNEFEWGSVLKNLYVVSDDRIAE